MSFTHLGPSWFCGFDVILELVFAVILLIVAFFAFRVYRTTNQQRIQLFGVAFLLIATSYIIQSLFNFLAISKANERICQFAKIQSILLFDAFGTYAHIVLMTLGLIILMYMTFRKKDLRILLLLTIISFLGIFLSPIPVFMFYVLSVVFLGFLATFFLCNFLKNQHQRTLLVAIAFLLLFVGSISFLLSTKVPIFSVTGHFFELIAYLLFLVNLYLVLR